MNRLLFSWMFPGLIWLGALASASAAPAPAKSILLLLPFESTRPVSEEILRGLEDGLRHSYPTRVAVFVEFIRSTPDAEPSYGDRLFEWLSFKYRKQEFDAICPVRPEGMALAEKLRERLWPNVPIVFGTTADEYRPDAARGVGKTGIVLDIGDNEGVRAALHLWPEARHIAVLGGAARGDRVLHERIVKLIQEVAPGQDVISVVGLSLAETTARVASLPAKTLIYLGQFSYDGAGRNLTAVELSRAIAGVAQGPLFGTSTLALGSGLVGGPLNSFERGGNELGKLVARVLAGADPGTLPVVRVSHVSVADWRELQKWKIPESRLPKGTEVRFRTLTRWEEFRGPILAGGGAILLQALLIAVLLAERRRRAESERAEGKTASLNKAILASLSGRIAILDQRGTILRVSENWRVKDGESDFCPSASPGDNYVDGWRGWAGDVSFEAIAKAINDVVVGHQQSRVGNYLIHIDGRHCWVEVRVERLDHPDGWAVVTQRDITRQRQTDLERRQALEDLHHMNRIAAVGELSGSIAHELAQPLASILSNAQAARRFAERPDPDLKEVCGALVRIADDDRRASKIIDGMRSILKKQPVATQDLDLNQTVEEVNRLIRNLLLIRGIQLRSELAPQGAVVRADGVSLQQVVLNLLNNAMEAVGSRPAGERRLTVRTSTRDGWGEVSIEDNGPGIPDQIQDRLFDSFFTTKQDGLGMGLSICRSIVQSFGGQIVAGNNADGGAAFRVTLPLALTTSAPLAQGAST